MIGWLEAFWHFLFGWPSLAILIGVAASVVAVIEPPAVALLVPNLRKFAILVAVVAFSITAIMGHYYNAGLNEIRAQVNDGLDRETAQGETAHDNAVRAVESAGSRGLQNDRWNRDVQRRR
jgi:hypothetical protein